MPTCDRFDFSFALILISHLVRELLDVLPHFWVKSVHNFSLIAGLNRPHILTHLWAIFINQYPFQKDLRTFEVKVHVYVQLGWHSMWQTSQFHGKPMAKHTILVTSQLWSTATLLQHGLSMNYEDTWCTVWPLTLYNLITVSQQLLIHVGYSRDGEWTLWCCTLPLISLLPVYTASNHPNNQKGCIHFIHT